MTIKTKNKLPLLLISAILFSLIFFLIVGYFTFLDTEWQRWQLLGQIRKNHTVLYNYKLAHSRYPDFLNQVGLKNRYCIFLKCFDIQYKVSDDKTFYTSAAKSNHPFVVFFDSRCTAIPILDENHKSICAQIGFEENYFGDRTDLPIYLKDLKWFSNPLDWPKL